MNKGRVFVCGTQPQVAAAIRRIEAGAIVRLHLAYENGRGEKHTRIAGVSTRDDGGVVITDTRGDTHDVVGNLDADQHAAWVERWYSR